MNYPFKDKFTANPQCDAEGFTVMDAKCVGCAPADMCPRSGHCERYMSPIRETHGISVWMVGQTRFADTGLYTEHDYQADLRERQLLVREADLRTTAALREHGAARLSFPTQAQQDAATMRNPKGWQEVDGVLLPHIAWGEPC